MRKKLSKAGKISLGLFSVLTGVGLLGVGTYFWIDYQKKNKDQNIIENETTLPPANPPIQNDNSLIPLEFPEYIDNHKVIDNKPTTRTRFFIDNLIDKNEIIKQIVDYENYVNNFDKQELSFNETKIKSKLSTILTNSLLKSNACSNKLENIEIYYQLINTKNVDDLCYNHLNIYFKWKGQSSDSFISKEYYDLLTLTLN